ncbi:MAG TPA: hypothetical protein VGB55_02360 [Tepidisphaeraceae bacterium]
MLEYNLTQRERQLLIELLNLSQHSKDHFEAWIVDPTASTGPTRELARLDFGNEGLSMELSKRDLRVLKDEGLIHFRWDLPHRGTGRLSSLAFEAVKTNFHSAEPGTIAALAEASDKRAAIADEKAIVLRFQKITAELVSLAEQLIDADEALSARNEAISITDELRKEVPDETILIRKIKGFVSRLSLTFSGTTDLALKGAMIGEFGERLAAWLVALSVWTEWHAAHHEPHDPCA